jgi:hypothetical protein
MEGHAVLLAGLRPSCHGGQPGSVARRGGADQRRAAPDLAAGRLAGDAERTGLAVSAGQDGLLCHCEAGEDGHPLGARGCGSVVKTQRYPSFNGRSSTSSWRATLNGEAWLDCYRAWSPSEIYRELARVASTPADRRKWRAQAELADHKFS